jgi:hypothetical protein
MNILMSFALICFSSAFCNMHESVTNLKLLNFDNSSNDNYYDGFQTMMLEDSNLLYITVQDLETFHSFYKAQLDTCFPFIYVDSTVEDLVV